MIANFAITYACDSRCRTCNIWKIQSKEHELSLDEIRSTFRDNQEFLSEVRYIQITGGEPFLRADLHKIISAIRTYLPKCTFWIPTNGLNPELIKQVARQILDVLDGNGLGVSVSLDGIGATHDKLRGVAGSYSNAVETLEKLAHMRKEYPKFNLTVGMTLTPDNIRELPEVFQIARRHEAEFSFRPVNFSDIYYRNPEGNFKLNGVINDLTRSIEPIKRDVVKRRGILSSVTTLRYMEGVLDYVRSSRVENFPCTAGSASMFIDPSGNVYPCIIMNKKLGNIRDKPLRDMWISHEAEESRRLIREGKCPGCWVECESFRDIHHDRMGIIRSMFRAIHYRLT